MGAETSRSANLLKQKVYSLRLFSVGGKRDGRLRFKISLNCDKGSWIFFPANVDGRDRETPRAAKKTVAITTAMVEKDLSRKANFHRDADEALPKPKNCLTDRRAGGQRPTDLISTPPDPYLFPIARKIRADSRTANGLRVNVTQLSHLPSDCCEKGVEEKRLSVFIGIPISGSFERRASKRRLNTSGTVPASLRKAEAL